MPKEEKEHVSQFYLWQLSSPPLLLRISDSGSHQIFARNEWSGTTILMEYFAGKRHDVEPIDTARVSALYPECFTKPS